MLTLQFSLYSLPSHYMRKLSTLLGNTPDNQLRQLTQQTNSHLKLRQLWQAAAPKTLADFSTVGNLHNGHLTIYADNASVATKIKLTSASLLTRLQKLQETERDNGVCKVTAISVKVQVKSPAPPRLKTHRKLSSHAARQLKTFADQLGDSALAKKLQKLAEKS
jgi:hypothetical protein